jgi:acyl CoA:acetate/3-ketoacid CoA transferase alpha subunit
MAELRTLLGLGTLYADATVEECAQAAQDLVESFLWFNTVPIAATALKNNVVTITTPIPHGLRDGQSVTISNAGATFNGTYTLTGYGTYTIEYAKTASDQDNHLVRPYGKITAPYHGVNYATEPAVREATATIAVTIWQSRQAPGSAVATIDGYIASPYTLGNTLIGKVRGILAPYLAPSGMAG